MKELKKKLMKMFCPSGKTLAGYAADGIAGAVNSSKEETRSKVAKYAAYAQEATRIANRLSERVNDGTIDSKEAKDLQEMLTPVFDKLLALV